MRLRLSCALVTVALVGACSGGDDAPPDTDTPQASVDEDQGVDMEGTAGDSEGVAPPGGTWDDPYPPYTPVAIDGWEVVIDDTLLMTEGPDPVNMPGSGAPDDGTVHVVVHVQATRTGDSPARVPTMGEGFTISLTNNGTEVGQNVAIPIDDEIPSGDVGPGSTVEGWMLARAHVPEGEVDGSAVTVKPFVAHPETYYVELPATE